jgi:2-keto-myo-inositol isomerase
MPPPELSRRQWLTAAAATAGAALTSPAGAAEKEPAVKDPFVYGFNTSTVRGQKLPIADVVDVAARAGYQAIEPWLDELDAHVKAGGSLADLGKRIRDHGLTVESAIGFAEWVVDDDEKRKKGLEQAKRDLDKVQQIGGKRLAAPPAGATKQADLNLLKAAERYRALLEAGDKVGVVPQVELWGFSRSLSRLGEVALVAIESGHPKACLLPDVYHLYKGGSDYSGFRLLSPAAVQVLHVNDYPANPGRAEITDAQRVFPGDGVAPLKELLKTLRTAGFHVVLSLELFNADYYKQDPLAVAREGLDKTKAAVKASLE